MGQIFIWVAQKHTINGVLDTKLLTPMQVQSAKELRWRHCSVLEVPVDLSVPKAIDWINVRALPGDVALALETTAFPNANVRGTSVFHIANNAERQTQAEQLLGTLMKHGPKLVSRGAQPDTTTATGSLAFTRQITIPALVLSLGYVTNIYDRALLEEQSYQLSQGIYNGLLGWHRQVSPRRTTGPFPLIDISIDHEPYGERGILVEGNAYVPADLIDRLGIHITDWTTVRLFDYGGITYIRAIDLREAGVLMRWDNETRTVLLRTLQPFLSDELSNIIGAGYLPPSNYETFLQQINPEALRHFPDIAQLYREEAAIEGVNPDIAFAQSLLETNFFGFSSLLKPEHNNFGGLGSTDGSGNFASFADARMGVRAHIQHLKAYATKEPLVQDVVDPRFSVVSRGVAPRVEQLSRRWSADAEYGNTILAILRRMYESAGLL